MVRSVILLLLVAAFSCGCLPRFSSSTNPLLPLLISAASGAAPVMLGETLVFCGYSGVSCCDAVDDAELREQFEAMNVSDASCARIVKETLCAMYCSPSLSTEDFRSTKPAATAPSLPHLLCASSSSSSPVAAHHRNTHGMCLERVAAGSYLNMAAHPDGSARVFLPTQDGNIWLASVPAHGSRGTLQIHAGPSPFLDLTDRVHYDEMLGLKGVAFHPDFATNGRFFVSYNCDSASPSCGAAAENRLRPSKYQLVVAEFNAKGGVGYSKGPSEVRRIFTMGLTQPPTSYTYQQHGGQIMFRPTDDDGYLYLITGYEFDPSQNKRRSPVGKIIRFDVDRSTPKMEIFAVGLSNPSGCRFDSERPSYLYCANVDQQQHEQVCLVSDKAAGSHSASSSKAVSSFNVIISHGRPAFGRMPSIVGGVVYQGSADPWLKGRYLYMYGSTMWAAVETPAGSGGRYVSARIPTIRCHGSTPLACRSGGIGSRVLSFGEDNSKDAFILATGGVYRVVRPGLCSAPPQPLQPTPTWLTWVAVFLAFAFYQIYSVILSGNGGAVTGCTGCCGCCFVTNNYYHM